MSDANEIDTVNSEEEKLNNPDNAESAKTDENDNKSIDENLTGEGNNNKGSKAKESPPEQKTADDENNGKEDKTTEEATIETLTEDLENFKNVALRSRADYDNLKKRIGRQKIETKNFLIREMAIGIFEAMDDFERALGAIGSPETIEEKGEKFDSVVQGVEMVIGKINEVLGGFGVEEIGKDGDDFDPNYHEAVQVIEAPDKMDQKIGKVFQKGYKIDDFVIRNAKVQVIRGTQASGKETEETEKTAEESASN